MFMVVEEVVVVVVDGQRKGYQGAERIDEETGSILNILFLWSSTKRRMACETLL